MSTMSQACPTCCHHASWLQDVSNRTLQPAAYLSPSISFNLAHCSAPADYEKWRFSRHRSSLHAFSFCSFPFAYDAAHKVDVLHYESASEQRDAFHAALMDSILSGGCPFLLLRVRPCSTVMLSMVAHSACQLCGPACCCK